MFLHYIISTVVLISTFNANDTTVILLGTITTMITIGAITSYVENQLSMPG